MDTSKHAVRLGKNLIEFELIRKNVENINLNVRSDMTVMISANADVPIEYIYNFVKRKAQWITNNLNIYKSIQPEIQIAKEYVSGETIKYLGKQYRIKIESTESDEQVKFLKGFLYIIVRDKEDIEHKKRLIDNWYIEKSKSKFDESLKRMFFSIGKHLKTTPNIKTRKMKKRWGSADVSQNNIILNSDLIKAPKYCIDYVVLHELVHFVYKNHNREFYDLLTVLMPDWEDRKRILDEEIIRMI